jgi:hypothetical protein
VKTLVIILLATGVFACVQTDVNATYGLMNVDSCGQAGPVVQENYTLSTEGLMAKVTNDSTINAPRTFRNNGDDDDDGVEDKKGNGGEESGPGRLWDAVELG